jgi:hypothetical protein
LQASICVICVTLCCVWCGWVGADDSVMPLTSLQSKAEIGRTSPTSEKKAVKRRRGVLRTEEDKFGVVTRRASVTIELKGGPRADALPSAVAGGTSEASPEEASQHQSKKKAKSAMDKVRSKSNVPAGCAIIHEIHRMKV